MFEGLRQSMSRKGNCWDNAPQESFFGHMKDHIKDRIAACPCYGDVKAVVDDYMDYYNNQHFRGISSPGQKRAGLRYSTVPLTTVPLLAHGEQGLIVFGFLFGCVNAQLFRLLLICWWRRCVWDIQWVGPTRDELIVFIWREFCQAPLVTLVIVIVHVIVHNRLDIFKKIRRLMDKYSLSCPVRKANPYRRMARALRTSSVADNLLRREFECYGPRMVLLTDITYLPYNGTFAYLSTILDAFTKQILSYALSPSLEVDFVLETVELLIKRHGISLHAETVIHSDLGVCLAHRA